jgi:hypothetical protein
VGNDGTNKWDYLGKSYTTVDGGIFELNMDATTKVRSYPRSPEFLPLDEYLGLAGVHWNIEAKCKCSEGWLWWRKYKIEDVKVAILYIKWIRVNLPPEKEKFAIKSEDEHLGDYKKWWETTGKEE